MGQRAMKPWSAERRGDVFYWRLCRGTRSRGITLAWRDYWDALSIFSARYCRHWYRAALIYVLTCALCTREAVPQSQRGTLLYCATPAALAPGRAAAGPQLSGCE